MGDDPIERHRRTAAAVLAPIDLGRWRDTKRSGVEGLVRLESGRPGPHVMVTALVHGNELCGAHALDHLLRRGLAPTRGRLSVCFANLAAYDRFDPGDPYASRFVDEDLNRVWHAAALDGPGRSLELVRARVLRPEIDRVDALLDLHSMPRAEPPLVLAGPLEKGRRLARRLGWPATVIADHGHHGGVRLRDYGPLGDPAAAPTALLVECGQHWAATSVEVAVGAVLRFLAVFGLLAPAWAADAPTPDPAAQRFIEVTHVVTIASDAFAFVRPFESLEVIPDPGTVIARDGDRRITTPYPDCILILPGDRRGLGQTAVRLGRTVAPPATVIP